MRVYFNEPLAKEYNFMKENIFLVGCSKMRSDYFITRLSHRY